MTMRFNFSCNRAIFLLVALFPPTVTSLIMSGPVALNVKFVLKPETDKTAFLTSLRDDQQKTLDTEPGALQFVIGQDDSSDNTIHLHEQYKTEADLDFHGTTKHFADFMTYCTEHDVFQQEPVIDTYKCQHAPTKIVPREAFCLNVESCIKPEFTDRAKVPSV